MKAIMYHYIREYNSQTPYFRYLAVENFIKQLDYFETEYDFVSYEEFNGFVNGEIDYNSISGKVLLTFDDGFIDHYIYVFPELKKRGLFGFFYIPTGVYKKQKALDVHRIHFLLGRFGGEDLIKAVESKIDKDMIKEKEFDYFKDLAYADQDNDFYTQEFKKLFNYYIKYEHRETLLDSLVIEFSNDKEIFTNLYMNIEQIKEMQEHNMIIGSHSVNHFLFSKLSELEQESEIRTSFEFLEQNLLKQNIKTFCYPYGGFESFTPYTERLLEKYNCDFSFNVEYRDIALNDFSNRAQAIPRFDCNQFPYGQAIIG